MNRERALADLAEQVAKKAGSRRVRGVTERWLTGRYRVGGRWGCGPLGLEPKSTDWESVSAYLLALRTVPDARSINVKAWLSGSFRVLD